MAYSYTEKKRIRKSFAKRPVTLSVPYLLATQIESFQSFLQEGVPVEKRTVHGLQAAFHSIFPIVIITTITIIIILIITFIFIIFIIFFNTIIFIFIIINSFTFIITNPNQFY